MSMYIEPKPIMDVGLEPIEVAIRREHTRIQDVEFDTGTMPSKYYHEWLRAERARGVVSIPTNI